jgi:predicted phosphodiesterase
MAAKQFQEDYPPSTQRSKLLFTFGIIADVQYADYNFVRSRYYRSSLVKLEEALKTFKNDSADFILNLGDIIDRDFLSYKPVLDIINKSGLKFYHITGNHDYSVDDRFKNELPVLRSPGESYYSFSYNNFRFILLNGNEISTYYSNNKKTIKEANRRISELRDNGELNGVEWNGGISKRQLTWLDDKLRNSADIGEKVFIVCHFPVFPDNAHNLLNYKEVLPVLTKYTNIIAWLNGHNHEGNYGEINNTHFITFRGMVESETMNSYAMVEVYENEILIKGFGLEENRVIEF